MSGHYEYDGSRIVRYKLMEIDGQDMVGLTLIEGDEVIVPLYGTRIERGIAVVLLEEVITGSYDEWNVLEPANGNS